ncbi:SDR family NAD(P)-dependent oxidoreductase [Rubrobacter marinus]|uniref:SDR family NAD(P)-dependent oxidoreductase n=1 Tax=Rubrobacter marinus TaxID=2653852 RepID=UPI001A9E5A02|nr:SDR family oxidoreductase [Rubrobacter marinus]
MNEGGKPTVLITGAGIGIGAATAREFAAAGYRVIVTDVLDEEGRGVVSEIEGSGGEAEYHRLDVTNTEQADAVVNDAQGRYGPLDAVIANAGIAHRVPLPELTDEKWDQTHEIDLKGVMRVCRAAAPAMREAGRGSMVAVSSIMGWPTAGTSTSSTRRPRPASWASCAASPSSSRGRGARQRHRPGYIRTAQALSEEHSLGPAGLEQAAEFIPMKRVGEPEDIADVILFLASSAARYLTGQTVVVDGGLLVGRY